MRLFVAIAPPAEARARLAGLATGLPGLRWVPPANYHLTLRFIGEVAPVQAEEVDLALGVIRAKRFPLELGGVGLFERGGRAGTLWAGVPRTPPLDHLQAKIETALTRAGLAPERRRFAPHVTVARLEAGDPRGGGWVAAHNLFRAPPFEVSAFTLFSSHRGHEQPTYMAEVEYALY